MSQFMMHDTVTGEGVTKVCLNMKPRPRLKQMTWDEARKQYAAGPCPVCMPFKVSRKIVVEKRG